MAIKADGVKAVSVGDLFSQSLCIPSYQRPYSWEPAMALQLVDDISMAQQGGGETPYVLGAVILHEEDNQFNVIDGQQRLLTLRMITAILGPDNSHLSPHGNSNAPASKVWSALRQRLKDMDQVAQKALLDFINTKCQLVRVVTDDIDEAFRVFDSQNYRGKPLAPHDLLKAHHLREMQGETDAMKVAIVQVWESVDDDDLKRLFSTYLYRIAKWSRRESALSFTIHDIGMFKGISVNRTLSPNAQYHFAAQAAMQLLNTLDISTTENARTAGRSRFQLDAPLIAGRPFFEMVAFMLEELKKLKDELPSEYKKFDKSQSRYRYVYELFIAALLYYTNKFGDGDLDKTQKKLFAWAYALRIELLRVQFRSVDNRAHAEQAVFVLLRNAMTGNVIHNLSIEVKPYNEGHEKELATFINGAQQHE